MGEEVWGGVGGGGGGCLWGGGGGGGQSVIGNTVCKVHCPYQ